jgi:hypothetical protein
VLSDFTVCVENDEIRVQFVSRADLGSLGSGHVVGGDYEALIIRVRASDSRRTQRAVLMHELGHYLVDRDELNTRGWKRTLPNDVTEEDVCDLFTWLPQILRDSRNGELRAFLGLDLIDD